MIDLLRVHALVRAARMLVLVASAADMARKVACRMAGAAAIEATARMDARDAARRQSQF